MVALRENTGFTGGNAAGLEIAVGDFVGLVNNDAHPHQTWLENLIQPMLEGPHYRYLCVEAHFRESSDCE